MPTERSDVQAGYVTYPDGKQGIVVLGGYYSRVNVEFLNLDTLLWEPRNILPYNIQDGYDVPYLNSFLIIGGDSYDLGPMEYFHYYDPEIDYVVSLDQGFGEYETDVIAFMLPDFYARCTV